MKPADAAYPADIDSTDLAAPSERMFPADGVQSGDAAAQEFITGSLNRASFGYIVSLLARLMAQSLKARNGPEGILPGQFPIVLELLNADGLTQRDLCRNVRIEQSTMANTLKRMERDGMIERRPCPEDGRQSTVHLTSKGTHLATIAVQNVQDMNRVALAGLDVSSQMQLRAALMQVIHQLDEDLTGIGDP